LLAGVALGIAFFVTQKAYHFLVPTLILLCATDVRDTWSSRVRQVAWVIFGGCCTLAAGYGCCAILGCGGTALHYTIQRSVSTGFQPLYGEWKHLFVELGRSPVFWTMGVLGTFAGLYRWQEDEGKRAIAALALAGAVLGLFVCFHAEKWPYLYLELLPTMALFVGFAVIESLRWIQRRTKNMSFVTVVGASFIVAMSVPSFLRVAEHVEQSPLQSYQLATIQWVESITGPRDFVFDGVGMVATRPRAYRDLAIPFQLAYRRGGEPDIVAALEHNECKAYIKNYRIASLPERERRWLDSHFVHDWGNVFVAGHHRKVTVQSCEFEIHATGSYQVAWSGSAPLYVDGDLVRGQVRLARGKHSIEANEPGTVTMKYRFTSLPPPLFKDVAIGRILGRFSD